MSAEVLCHASSCRCRGASAAQVLPASMALATSPLLQAAPLEALQAFFVALVACKPAKTPFKALLEQLLEAGKQAVSDVSADRRPGCHCRCTMCCCAPIAGRIGDVFVPTTCCRSPAKQLS